MNYFIVGLLVVWFSVFAVLLVRTEMFVHRVSVCLVPGASYWKSYMRDVFEWRFWKMKPGMLATFDPADLTEAGREYLKQGMRVERILMLWGIGGFILIACASYRSL